uniref:AB hydrolase-1 domain-containing protein n=1 Tax=Phlebotomus papatasi TaxID=29031 RepID=A0A1B0DIM7_PHLPP
MIYIDTEFTEVEIPVPWGHVAGKWYGPADVRPILILHGWLDNAGSYDTLIPLLPKDRISYLAIDLPGHGFSSHIPEGMTYSHYDYLWLIHRIREIYGWPKVSLMGHSLGAVLNFLYTAIFPQDVDMIINLDGMIPMTTADFVTKKLIANISNTTKFMIQHLNPKSQPSYSKEELIERMIASSYGSLSAKDCEYLLRRGIKGSESKPNKFILTSDSRLKSLHVISLSQECYDILLQGINCPILNINSDTKQTAFSKQNISEKSIEDMKKKNPNFQNHKVSGKHHVHLSHPERVSGLITEFVLKYRSVKSKM